MLKNTILYNVWWKKKILPAIFFQKKCTASAILNGVIAKQLCYSIKLSKSSKQIAEWYWRKLQAEQPRKNSPKIGTKWSNEIELKFNQQRVAVLNNIHNSRKVVDTFTEVLIILFFMNLYVSSLFFVIININIYWANSKISVR